MFAQTTGISDGIKYFNNNDYKNAKNIFEQIFDNNDKNAETAYYLGRIFHSEKDTKKAEEWMEKAVDLDSDNAVYRYWLALAYWERSNHVNMFSGMRLGKKGVKELKKAIELKPNYVEAIIEYASFLHGAPGFVGGDKDLSRKQVENLIKINPSRGHLLKGIFLKRDEKYESALQEFDKANKINPDNDTTYYHIGLLYAQSKEQQKSFKSFEKSLSINPKNKNSLYQLGKTCVLAKTNTDRGIECLNLYLTDKSPDGNAGPDAAHWRLGMLFELNGDINQAIDEYKTAIKINPDKKKYKKALKNIQDK